MQRQAACCRETTVNRKSLARADPVLPGQCDHSRRTSANTSAREHPAPGGCSRLCLLCRCCQYSHHCCWHPGTDRLIHLLLAPAGSFLSVGACNYSGSPCWCTATCSAAKERQHGSLSVADRVTHLALGGLGRLCLLLLLWSRSLLLLRGRSLALQAQRADMKTTRCS